MTENRVERSCVYKFIQGSQKNFRNGASLTEVIDNVERYQKIARKAYGNFSYLERPIHRVGTSRVGLSTLALYEYARYRWIPLPDSNTIIESLTPLRDMRRALCGGRKSPENSQELISF